MQEKRSVSNASGQVNKQDAMTSPSTAEETDDYLEELLCHTLRNDVKVPKLGYWNVLSKNVSQDVSRALAAGYRHVIIDVKGDRDDVIGDVINSWIQNHKTSRKRLFISLMVDLRAAGTPASLRQTINRRLGSLGCRYVDMLILSKADTKSMGDNLRQKNAVLAQWRCLEKLVADNVTRSLGLANFRQDDVETILSSSSVKPDSLWFSVTPTQLGWADTDRAGRYCQYRQLLMGVIPKVDRPEAEWMRRHGPALKELSRELSRTPLQVLQRFYIQKNFLVCLAADSKVLDSSFKVFDFYIPPEKARNLDVVF